MPLGPVEIPPSGGSQEVGIAQAVLAPRVTNEQPGNYRKGHRKLPAARDIHPCWLNPGHVVVPCYSLGWRKAPAMAWPFGGGRVLPGLPSRAQDPEGILRGSRQSRHMPEPCGKPLPSVLQHLPAGRSNLVLRSEPRPAREGASRVS